MQHKKKLIVISGPTAVGKTEIAIQTALEFKTEIISADSRQFYREMNIGTAVPTQEQKNMVKHHFVQHISIHDSYDVAVYEQQALRKIIEGMEQHDHLVFSGGSGMFIDAVCFGLDSIPKVNADIRSKIEELYRSQGIEKLQQELQKYDPDYYAVVDQKNPRRLQRALEVCFQTGKPFSSFRKQRMLSRPFDIIWIGLERDRNELINRINNRVEQMIAKGLLAEAKALLPYRNLNALNTVGYKELFAYFDGKIQIEEAVEQIKINTRRYAKRQMTWMRKNPEYTWFNADNPGEIMSYIKRSI